MRGVCGAVEVSQQDYVLTEERIDDGLAGALVPNFVWPIKRRDAYRGHEGVGVQVQLGGYEDARYVYFERGGFGGYGCVSQDGHAMFGGREVV